MSKCWDPNFKTDPEASHGLGIAWFVSFWGCFSLRVLAAGTQGVTAHGFDSRKSVDPPQLQSVDFTHMFSGSAGKPKGKPPYLFGVGGSPNKRHTHLLCVCVFVCVLQN